MQAIQTYFCGTKAPIAAEMDGAKFFTSQCVYVAFCKGREIKVIKSLCLWLMGTRLVIALLQLHAYLKIKKKGPEDAENKSGKGQE